jgi:hypothetical protein
LKKIFAERYDVRVHSNLRGRREFRKCGEKGGKNMGWIVNMK